MTAYAITLATISAADLDTLRGAIADGTIRGLALSALALYALRRAALDSTLPPRDRLAFSTFGADCLRAILAK